MVLNDFKDLKDFNDTKDFCIRCLRRVPSFSKGGAGVVCKIHQIHVKLPAIYTLLPIKTTIFQRFCNCLKINMIPFSFQKVPF